MDQLNNWSRVQAVWTPSSVKKIATGQIPPPPPPPLLFFLIHPLRVEKWIGVQNYSQLPRSIGVHGY